MCKRRIPPPLEVSSKGNRVTAPIRVAEVSAEFHRRLNYLLVSFSYSLASISFNASLARLKQTVRRGPTLQGPGERLHPALELLVNVYALEHAIGRMGQDDPPIIQQDIEDAAKRVAATVPAERGRPRAAAVEHYVGGLMALIQETTGRPVLSSREMGSGEYKPHLALGVSQSLLHLRKVDPSITETQLANKVLELRKAYAGRAMRFRDFFPLYGASVSTDGGPVCVPPVELKYFRRCHPIYCR